MADQESPIAAAEKAKILKLQSFQDTDAGNAEAFELLHGERFRFDHTKSKWLVWNNRFWEEDKDGEADRAALDTARERLSAAALVNDKGIRGRVSNGPFVVSRSMVEKRR